MDDAAKYFIFGHMNEDQYITTLAKLFSQLPGHARDLFTSEVSHDALVTGIAHDSRFVKPGNIFVARAGAISDGHRFIPEAIARGASVIIGEELDYELPVPYLHVIDSRAALAHLVAGYYHFPSRNLICIGVTGTDGKTTTCSLIHQILKTAGKKAGLITTVNALIGDRIYDTGFHVTTPEATDLQRYLAKMVEAGLTHVVLEVTSHGLDQHRVTGCEFDIGVITNITHEHLDYHGSYDAYRDAKARLFTSLLQPSLKKVEVQHSAVFNRDDLSFEYLSSGIWSLPYSNSQKLRQITFGFSPEANVRADNIRYKPNGSFFDVVLKNQRIPIQSNLIGEYNVLNCLAAVAVTYEALNVDFEAVKRGIEQATSIPGRMEIINKGQEFLAIVDFAHTPNALRKSLEAIKKLLDTRDKGGRAIAIFGSAGLRDRAKRGMMAGISIELADMTIFTAEDPRTESLTLILEEMAEGAVMQGGVEGENFWRVPDRGNAIRFGLAMAKPEDIVIALGKGHEQSMCFEDVEYQWDDRIAMEAGLAELLKVDGPPMPTLPTSENINPR